MKEQVLTIKANENSLDKETILGLRGTKALWVAIPGWKEKIKVTTWSSLIREIITNWFSEHLVFTMCEMGEIAFKQQYETIFNQKLKSTGIKLNTNCPIGIYKDDDIDNYITSSVYLNNKNHKLKLFEFAGHTENVCAVYTGEIVLVLATLLELVNNRFNDKTTELSQKWNMKIGKDLELQIGYIDRDDMLEDEMESNLNFTINSTTVERDLVKFTLKMKDLILDTYKLTLNSGLAQSADMMKDVFMNEIPNEFKRLD